MRTGPLDCERACLQSVQGNVNPVDIANVIALLGATAVIVAAVVTGIFTVIVRRMRTPETAIAEKKLTQDAVAAAQALYQGMLMDASNERKELRQTITELEQLSLKRGEDIRHRDEAIARLNEIIRKKDEHIRALEARQRANAEKLRQGELLTLEDILGEVTDTIPTLS